MSATSYNTFEVDYEHTTEASNTVRQNRATITIWGDSEFKVKAELEKQRPEHKNIVILSIDAR